MGKNFGRPNTKRALPNVLNKKQLIQLFEAIDDVYVFMACMIALFCGLRISEVCNLKKQDVDLESEKIMVRGGKGDKDRVVMLPKSMIPLIQKWYRMNESELFVCNSYNHRFYENFLSAKFRGCLEKAGLKIKTFKTSHGQQRYAYSFHTLRHTYATYLLEQGVDLYYVQRSLGHVDIHTTQIYAYISNKDLQNKINQAFCKKKQKMSYESYAATNSYAVTNDPMTLLKLRYANGELNEEELQQKMEILRQTNNTFYG